MSNDTARPIKIKQNRKVKKEGYRDSNTLVLEDHNSVAASELSHCRHALKPSKKHNKPTLFTDQNNTENLIGSNISACKIRKKEMKNHR